LLSIAYFFYKSGTGRTDFLLGIEYNDLALMTPLSQTCKILSLAALATRRWSVVAAHRAAWMQRSQIVL